MISIHAPHEGSDNNREAMWQETRIFQSTLPMRGATALSQCVMLMGLFQSTLPMRGATELSVQEAPEDDRFQSTLPMRGATTDDTEGKPVSRFQSTLPMRGAT